MYLKPILQKITFCKLEQLRHNVKTKLKQGFMLSLYLFIYLFQQKAVHTDNSHNPLHVLTNVTLKYSVLLPHCLFLPRKIWHCLKLDSVSHKESHRSGSIETNVPQPNPLYTKLPIWKPVGHFSSNLVRPRNTVLNLAKWECKQLGTYWTRWFKSTISNNYILNFIWLLWILVK